MLQTVAEAPPFIRRARKLLSETEHFDLLTFLVSHPLAGDEIVGTGGVRKVRFGAMGRASSEDRLQHSPRRSRH